MPEEAASSLVGPEEGAFRAPEEAAPVWAAEEWAAFQAPAEAVPVSAAAPEVEQEQLLEAAEAHEPAAVATPNHHPAHPQEAESTAAVA